MSMPILGRIVPPWGSWTDTRVSCAVLLSPTLRFWVLASWPTTPSDWKGIQCAFVDVVSHIFIEPCHHFWHISHGCSRFFSSVRRISSKLRDVSPTGLWYIALRWISNNWHWPTLPRWEFLSTRFLLYFLGILITRPSLKNQLKSLITRWSWHPSLCSRKWASRTSKTATPSWCSMQGGSGTTFQAPG